MKKKRVFRNWKKEMKGFAWVLEQRTGKLLVVSAVSPFLW